MSPREKWQILNLRPSFYKWVFEESLSLKGHGFEACRKAYRSERVLQLLKSLFRIGRG